MQPTFVARGMVVLAVLSVLLTACAVPGAGPTQTVPTETVPAGTSAIPRPDHTVVVLLENEDSRKVLGSSAAPYLTGLARQGATMTESYGVTHPSQPNYLALFSGSPQGTTNDFCPRNFSGRPNLATQLAGAGLTFTGFAESMPSAGYTGCATGRYQRKHNPWVDFDNVPASSNQTFDAFPSDYTKLPTVAFVTPNMCHDMHDCSVRTGDDWVRDNLGAYAVWARSHNSLLVVTFDENSGGTVNPIATILVGAMVRPGIYTERMDHYTLLRTLEAAHGLAPLGNAARQNPLSDVWSTSATPGGSGIHNGSFESGLRHWARSGKTMSSTTQHHKGKRSARAGALTATRGNSVISQTMVAPVRASKLSVWWEGRCKDKVAKAWATIVVDRNTSGKHSTLLPRTCVAHGAWKRVQVGVTPGHSYTVRLINHDDGAKKTPNRTYFDAVSVG